MNEPRADKPAKLTREEVALIEVGQTTISRPTAWTLTISFLVLIIAVPVIDSLEQMKQGIAVVDYFSRIPRVDEFTFPIHRQAVEERNRLHDIEHGIEDASWLKRSVQPYVQNVLSSWLHTGNSSVVRGRDDWLFYRPGLDYLAGPGFLRPDHRFIHPRREGDPRPAILAFQRDCQALGIRLVLVPIPDKAMVEGAFLAHRLAVEPVDNADYARFADEMTKAGVEIWSPLSLLRSNQAPGERYLRQDTHWTPQAMDDVAMGLATHLALPPAARPVTWMLQDESVSRVGDLVDTLRLPTTQTVFAPQSVRIGKVFDVHGKPWASVSNAEVLLLGDSFTNIFADEGMGWGKAAGFGAHLALYLQRDVEVIAINGGGAHATRRTLAGDLARGVDRLAGKRVIVWEFAVRELAVGEWPVIPITAPVKAVAKTQALPAYVPPSGGSVRVTARVSAVSKAPRPAEVTYKDHLISVCLTDLQSDDPGIRGHQARAYVISMRDKVWTDAARWRVGEQVTVTLQDWDDVADGVEQFDKWNRADLVEPEFANLPPVFATPVVPKDAP